MSGLNVNPTNIANWVMYSDDFGKNWKILGDAMTPAIPHSADEPKCEELPDGSIVVSSRRGSGRWFNVFRFTDSAKGEGYWDTMAHSPLVKATANACNGELLIVPVVKKATGKRCISLSSPCPSVLLDAPTWASTTRNWRATKTSGRLPSSLKNGTAHTCLPTSVRLTLPWLGKRTTPSPSCTKKKHWRLPAEVDTHKCTRTTPSSKSLTVLTPTLQTKILRLPTN